MAPAISQHERVHFLDAARATMLLLGIPFHSSEIYRISNGWMIDSPDGSYIASGITAFIHLFRMPAFFMLSGYFASLLLHRRTPRAWIADRLWKLGVPLVATAILLGPIETGLVLSFNQNMPLADAVNVALHLPARDWVNHRWFLIVLILYCATAAFLTLFARERIKAEGPRLIGSSVWRFGKFPMLLAIPFFAIAIGKLFGEYTPTSFGLKEYANYYVKYAVFFTAGYMAHTSFGNMAQIMRLRPMDIVVGGLSVGLYLLTYFAFYSSPPFAAGSLAASATVFVRIGCEVIAGYYAAKLFFNIMGRLVTKHNAVIGYFVAASFCIYLVHELFLLTAGGLLLYINMPPVLEILLITAVTVLGSICVFEIVRRSTLLSTIFNGGPIRFAASAKTERPTLV